MSLKEFFKKKPVIVFIIVIIVLVLLIIQNIRSKTQKEIIPVPDPTTTTQPTPQPTVVSEAEYTKFLRQYQFMFWHLPNSVDSLTFGWMGDTPVVIKDNQIFNPYKNTLIKKLTDTEVGLLNNGGEALIISADKQKILNLSTLVEKEITQKERESFSYIWYDKPNSVIALSEDKKSLFLVSLIDNQKKVIAQTDNLFNPFSLTSNNTVVAVTDSKYLYIYNNQLIKIPLDDTTKESITFWVDNELYLVEKVTKPRLLDFIMVVDIGKQQFKQVITSSSQTNRLNLKIKPAVNQKNDMVLFSENNGLVWILSKDQAITRIYPQLKLPPEAWSNPAP